MVPRRSGSSRRRQHESRFSSLAHRSRDCPGHRLAEYAWRGCGRSTLADGILRCGVRDLLRCLVAFMSRPWQPLPDLPQPGIASDRVVAEAHGVHRQTVIAYRRRNGIEGGGQPGRPKGSGWNPKPDPDLPMPGEAPDHTVAKAHEATPTQVLRWRHRRGIPAFNRNTSHPYDECGCSGLDCPCAGPPGFRKR